MLACFSFFVVKIMNINNLHMYFCRYEIFDRELASAVLGVNRELASAVLVVDLLLGICQQDFQLDK